MIVADNRTTRKDNNKYQTTNIIYDQNSMSIMKKKLVTKSSNSHQIIPKGNNWTYTLVEKIFNWLTGWQKIAGRCEVQNYVSIIENN